MTLVLEFLFELIFGVIFCWTGEIILFILTLGRHKPRWDLYTEESPTRFVILSEISTWIGMIFWFIVLVLVIKFSMVK
jgi:hypothetical protein